MPKINGTRRPSHTEKSQTKAKVESNKASSTKKAAETRRASSVASDGEGPSVSTRGTSVSSYSSGGEGATYNPPAPRETYTYPTRNVWSSGGGGE